MTKDELIERAEIIIRLEVKHSPPGCEGIATIHQEWLSNYEDSKDET